MAAARRGTCRPPGSVPVPARPLATHSAMASQIRSSRSTVRSSLCSAASLRRATSQIGMSSRSQIASSSTAVS